MCYDCNNSYNLLNEIILHSRRDFHCEERCLKCLDTVLVFEQISPKQTIRLHTCKRLLLRHQNNDLCVLSQFVSSVLNFFEPTNFMIPCNSCELAFPQTNEGLNQFLIHSNVTFHNCTYNCRGCTLPQFKVGYDTKNGSTERTTHFCIRDGKCKLEWYRLIMVYSFEIHLLHNSYIGGGAIHSLSTIYLLKDS